MSLSINARANLVRDTYQATITNVSNNNNFSIGETFSWTVTYDYDQLRMYTYGDGSNGIAEFGRGDDSINDIACMTGYVESGCVYYHAPIHLSDGVFNFGYVVKTDSIAVSEPPILGILGLTCFMLAIRKKSLS